MKTACLVIGLNILLLPYAALSQPATRTPAFEMADVQATPPDAPSRGGGVLSGGRFEMRGETLLSFISRAYGVPDDRIQGGPVWLDTDRFDVFATASPNALATSLRPMLQALLTDRFKLVTHTDSRALPVYALVAGGRPLLKQSSRAGEAGCEGDATGAIRVLACHGMTMDQLVEKLAGMAGPDLDRPLVDATGLKNAYDFTLSWTPRHLMPAARGNGADSPMGRSLLAAIDEQLGLKMEARRQPMPVLIVDRVNRTPADTGSGPPPFPKAFAAAEVRASAPHVTPSADITGDRFVYFGISMKRMLAIAYNVGDERIAGGPKWLDTDRFDTIAKAPSVVPTEVLRAMFRTLIVERFKLTFHLENRPVPVFALSVGKHAPKLKKADSSSRSQCKLSQGDTARTYACQNTTMEQLAQKVRLAHSNIIKLQVVDLTGIKGAYDFAVTFDPSGRTTNDASGDPATDAMPVAATPNRYLPFMEAMEEQLGLKLKVQNHPMPVMVIDHLERVPVEN
jgi:uncharacterized protein (TIGR03435 family)